MIDRAGISKKKPEKQTYEAFIMLTESEKSEIIRAPNSDVQQLGLKSTRDHSKCGEKKEIGGTILSAPPSEHVLVHSPAARFERVQQDMPLTEELCSLVVRNEVPVSSLFHLPKETPGPTNHLLKATFCKPVQPSGEEEPIYPSVSVLKSGNDINLTPVRGNQNKSRRLSSKLGYGSIPVFQLMSTFEENNTLKAMPNETVIREEENRNPQIDTNVDLSTILKSNPQFQKYLLVKYSQNPSLHHIHRRLSGVVLAQQKHFAANNEAGLHQDSNQSTRQ